MVNKYYLKHKEKLQKKAWERYQNFFQEKTDKSRDRYKNLLEEKNPKTMWVYEKILFST